MSALNLAWVCETVFAQPYPAEICPRYTAILPLGAQERLLRLSRRVQVLLGARRELRQVRDAGQTHRPQKPIHPFMIIEDLRQPMELREVVLAEMKACAAVLLLEHLSDLGQALSEMHGVALVELIEEAVNRDLQGLAALEGELGSSARARCNAAGSHQRSAAPPDVRRSPHTVGDRGPHSSCDRGPKLPGA